MKKKKQSQLKLWEELPGQMKNQEVRRYYEILQKKSGQIKIKRIFDRVLACLMILLLSPIMFGIAALIYKDSGSPVFYRQVRVTQYGKKFQIYKFRTMIPDADKQGPAVTGAADSRITKIGTFLRKTRLDELPQLFNIASGEMSFVGTRPEVPMYVEKYSPKMWATLLLPAGVTSLTSIKFKDEAELLKDAKNVDAVYIKEILPQKMKWNLKYLKEFSLWKDIKIMIQTVLAVVQ